MRFCRVLAPAAPLYHRLPPVTGTGTGTTGTGTTGKRYAYRAGPSANFSILSVYIHVSILSLREISRISTICKAYRDRVYR